MNIVSPVIPALLDSEVVIAKDQPEYQPLPSLRCEQGQVICRLEFSAEDLARILDGASLYLCFLTFNKPLQPFMTAIAHHAEDQPEEILAQFGLELK